MTPSPDLDKLEAHIRDLPPFEDVELAPSVALSLIAQIRELTAERERHVAVSLTDGQVIEIEVYEKQKAMFDALNVLEIERFTARHLIAKTRELTARAEKAEAERNEARSLLLNGKVS